jgi:ArsR family transcriptional regulator, arsenate/arsenite/antimonite-responsive transcriptional repressor / arsenate reductase (thioredoxin)
MELDQSSDLAARAAVHRALGDEHRLAIVDALVLSDRSPSELRELVGIGSNLLAFHLDVLEEAGLITRRASEGDARRRYITLRPDRLGSLSPTAAVVAQDVLFVCTANSARSQLAAALWAEKTGGAARSAGTEPADRVHPLAVTVARRHGLDLSNAVPCHLVDVTLTPDLVVSVCDRARETGMTAGAPALHWSVPDPAGGDADDFERAFDDLASRIDRLATASAP